MKYELIVLIKYTFGVILSNYIIAVDFRKKAVLSSNETGLKLVIKLIR